MGGGYGALAGDVVLAGGLVLVATNLLREHGPVGRLLASGAAVWFWLVGLHLVGRLLRAMGLLEKPV